MEKNNETIKELAINSNNKVWEFLQKSKLTEDESVEMLVNAYASLHLWSLIGTDINLARGYWIISRACCIANEGRQAIIHAEMCKKSTEAAKDKAESFDEFYSLEALARAYAINRNIFQAKLYKEKAIDIANSISDQETKDLCFADLKSEPWFGIND